ncbi:unnamed protein product [Prorocentrum cordatum]|uniref:Apple domain-containing protein n=1 Tax=Prorocentrum cordatum TaxID=2364126 RepID=A0ABN9UFZ0_9DINO|nr:unnamed protein product [Polarella glacialis]
MAWALSQIFVTFSPLMGDYLTFEGSRSWDASGWGASRSYPDENFAREIMQLFTIGVAKLTPDGHVQVDDQGVDQPTYDNDDIMNFARVFTGFVRPPARDNIELRNGQNLIDPMRLRAGHHDVFPKRDLYGGYLGDGLPLCSELPSRPFLLPGARFEFHGSSVPNCTSEDTEYDPRNMPGQGVTKVESIADCQQRCASVAGCAHFTLVGSESCHLQDGAAWPVYRQHATAGPPGDCEASVFEPEPGSELLRALCGGDVGDCRPAPSRTLASALACRGAECSLDSLSIVKAAGGYYEFVPPACVHPFFFQERYTTDAPVQVHEDGSVSAHTEDLQHNRFLVSWIGPGRAPAGSYNATVGAAAVFGTTPSSADVLATLKVTALGPPPGAECVQPCGGDVKVWGSSPPDVDTVFEVGGRFYRNGQSVVDLGPASFRNPPVFVGPGPLRQYGRALERAVRAEVDSLLDHLLHHPNTPVFISKKLIQRFVTSNPSPPYLESVARAFTTGSHDGVTYSGEVGDLGAAIAAILLHPEARSSDSNTAGLLREPILKLVHLMRSMEYVDVASQEVVLENLDEVIGQFPYRSPTVFNFYDHMYQPPSFADAAMMSEPESEPEPEPETLVAPEFQIFTPPFAIGFLNGVASLLDHGVSKCEDGLGSTGHGKECRQGSLSFAPVAPDVAESVVRELDVLLTGGRLAPASRELVRAAYEGHGLLGAQQAVVLTPEFQTLGAPQHEGERSAEGPPPPSGARDSYRALVMLFLHGGADTYNLLVPIGCSLYGEYAAVRTSMAIAEGSLLPVTASSEQPCGQFGIHPALPFLRELYETRKQAAFVSSVGALVEPVTKETFGRKTGGAKTCLGLFSHSHQQIAAHTLKCQVPGAAPRGGGGRMADVLAASHGKDVASFSTMGIVTWSGGFSTAADIIDRTDGAIRFNKYQVWNSTISGISKQKYGSMYCEEYTRAFADHIRSSEALGAILENVELETAATYEAKTTLAQQLHKVALLIKARSLRLAERDFFFVQIGGFDTHGSQDATLSERFEEIDGALRDFVGELTQQGVFDDVVIVTHSDFGRTLTSNGGGTDHGWAGNHVILGGGINGGQIFNRFLQTYAPDSAYDAGRGRVIPRYPWESVMVPIAEWMGVEDQELEAVFPNLPNFNRSADIISRGSLFKS